MDNSLGKYGIIHMSHLNVISYDFKRWGDNYMKRMACLENKLSFL